MLSIAEQKARRAEIMKRYHSKPDVRAKRATREQAQRDAKRVTPKRSQASRAGLSDQEIRARRAAQQRTRMQQKRSSSLPTPELPAQKRSNSSPAPKLSAQEKKDRVAAQARSRRDAKRDKAKKFSRKGLSDQEKKARRAAQMREWRAAHVDISRARAAVNNNRLRARANTTGGDFTRQEWQALCARYSQQCVCCKAHAPLTVDHVIPLIKGGTNDIGNIQPLCGKCNRRKGIKETDYR